jgi:hypothetical protein
MYAKFHPAIKKSKNIRMKRLLPVLLMFISCGKSNPPYNPPPAGDRFAKVPDAYVLSSPISEASGIADSKTIKDHLWVIEDSGNPPRLFLLKHEGFVTDSFVLAGAVNRDWEDVAVGKGPDDALTYLYVGDIGDNSGVYPSYTIYRMPEPGTFVDEITGYDSIKFTYPDGSHDAEAFMIDDNTKDIFVITKRDAVSRIYRIPYPQDTQNMNQAEFVLDLTYTGVVSATLSLAGTEVIMKTYTQLFYYSRTPKEGLGITLAKAPADTLDYQLEPQGEAVCFANDNSGFFTLSEKGMANTLPNLMFYKRTR